MGRSSCSDENGLRKGPWTPEEDQKLIQHIKKHGQLAMEAGEPSLNLLVLFNSLCLIMFIFLNQHSHLVNFHDAILNLHSILGNKWSAIASHLPGRTDNEIKNFWNTHLKKKLVQMGFDPMTHRPRTDFLSALPQLLALADLGRAAGLQAVQAAKLQHLLQSANAMEAMSIIFPCNTCPDHDQANYQPSPFLCEPPTNQECFSMAAFGHEEDSSRPALLASRRSPLPPNNDASVINQRDGCSISSYGSGNGSDSIWAELLLDDQFMAEFD